MNKLVKALSLLTALLMIASCAAGLAEGDYAEPMEINIWLSEYSNAPFNPESHIWPVASEKFNITLNVNQINEADYNDKVQTMLAGGDMPDMFMADLPTMSQYFSTGIVLKLDDLLAEYGKDYLAELENHGLTKYASASDGSFYCFNCIDESFLLSTYYYINADWMEGCGITEMPTTYEELYTVLKAFKEKYGATDGNVMMSNGYYCSVPNVVYLGFGAYNNWIMLNEEDGMVYAPYFYKDNLKAALTYLNKLYSEGLLAPEFVTMDANAVQQLVYSKQVGVYYAWMDEAADYMAEYGASLNYLPLPLLQAGEGYTTGYYGKSQLRGAYFISGTCDPAKAQRIVEFINYFYSPEGAKLIGLGVEGVDYTEAADGTVTISDEIMNGDKIVPDNARDISGALCNNWPKLEAWQYWKEYVKPAMNTMIEDVSQYALPAQPNLVGSDEEEMELANIMNDLKTYVDTSLAKFITGEMSIDTDWDGFVSTMEDLNVVRAQEIKAGIYETWKNK